MLTVKSVAECKTFLKEHRKNGLSIGFVPTMGALHDGHLSLVRKSITENNITVMSIFVNPTQFGPKEDFASYPRSLKKDLVLAESEKTDLLFIPSTEEIYKNSFSTYVEETTIARPLCGQFRPVFFKGVCTVTLKLLNTIQPDRLYLGQKDAQQLRVLEKMIEDLNLGIQVIGCPTIREKDGLAMSSRNIYLSSHEREVAPTIYAALKEAESAFLNGERVSQKLIDIAKQQILSKKIFELQYLEVKRWKDFESDTTIKEPSLLAVAAFLGRTRLIDNIFLDPTT